MPKNKTDIEIFQGIIAEYYDHKKRYDEQQSICKEQLLIPMAMKDAAEKCCNYIYNIHILNSSEKMSQVLNRKSFLFFKHYVEQIKIQKKGHSIRFLNAVEVANQVLKDHPEFIPAPKEYPLKDSYGLYGDYFRIDGQLCLITGSGKSKAMRKVSESEETSLDFAYFDVESDCLSFHGEPIAYFIHMAKETESSEDEVSELSAEKFLLYAYGNYGTSQYECPEEILPVLKLGEEFNIPMLLVPWGETHEDKIKAITNYFEQQKLLKTRK